MIAFKLAPNLSIGGGVMVDYGKIGLESGHFPVSTTPFANFYRFKGDGWSVGYNLGVLWQPHEKISLGATFRSATQFTMDGHTEFERLTAAYRTQPCRPMRTLRFPLTAVFGVSYRPTPKWNLEFDADYTDWGSFETTTIYQQGSPPPVERKTHH